MIKILETIKKSEEEKADEIIKADFIACLEIGAEEKETIDQIANRLYDTFNFHLGYYKNTSQIELLEAVVGELEEDVQKHFSSLSYFATKLQETIKQIKGEKKI